MKALDICALPEQTPVKYRYPPYATGNWDHHIQGIVSPIQLVPEVADRNRNR